MAHTIPNIGEGSIWRPRWFLMTRVYAIAGVIVALVFSYAVFHLQAVNYTALFILTIVFAVTDFLYFVYFELRILPVADDDALMKKRLALFIGTQISLDLLLLTLMLHFSGGATNPFIFYYISF